VDSNQLHPSQHVHGNNISTEIDSSLLYHTDWSKQSASCQCRMLLAG